MNPAKSKLFYINTNSKKLLQEKHDKFHSITAKLLWVSQWSRPDIELAVSFLTDHVPECTKEDWGKLRRILVFLKCTIEDHQFIRLDNLDTLSTWIDATYAIHMNMQGHTGGAMSFGWGVVHSKLKKQKLNTKSSTETEVVAVSDYVPYKIWLIIFWKHKDIQSKIRFCTKTT